MNTENTNMVRETKEIRENSLTKTIDFMEKDILSLHEAIDGLEAMLAPLLTFPIIDGMLAGSADPSHEVARPQVSQVVERMQAHRDGILHLCHKVSLLKGRVEL
ncbi:MAG TPA: hypothetical protein VFT87_01065 [Candidatus Saccharimonadales bacterium]|nr:hypothetical protein [Candidatus Saccharimonadales bacterium]